MNPPVTRFAPSPTGPLHIGGARTALYNFLYARGRGGKFLLRMEDTDRERSTREFEREILDSLAWLGLNWDGEPLYQSGRFDDYRRAAEDLIDQGKAYRDYTTQKDLDAMRAEAEQKKEPFRFREELARKEPPAPGADHVIRFRTKREGTLVLEDAVLGRVETPAHQIDDFVILRSDGTPVFHLCNVLDDLYQGVTLVIRGVDHQTNTFKHLQLYEAFGENAPRYAHIPLIAGPDGKKLSKRLAATSVLEYREQGYLPEGLVNFLVRIGWSHGDQEIFSLEELVAKFDLDHVGKSMGAFNPEKLDWINQHWMKESTDKRLAGLLREYLRREPGLAVPEDERLERIVAVQKERSKTIRELAESSVYFFERPTRFDEKAARKFLDGEHLSRLAEYAEALRQAPSFEAAVLENFTNEWLEKRDLKLKHIAQPLRVALTGGTVSPGIFDVLEILGKEEVLARIEAARNAGRVAARS